MSPGFLQLKHINIEGQWCTIRSVFSAQLIFSPLPPEEQQDQHGNSQHDQRDAVADGVYQLHRDKVRLLRL